MIQNDISHTLFDKSLQASDVSSSVLEPFTLKEFQKQNEMLTNRKLVSSKMRESLIKMTNIKNDNLVFNNQDEQIIQRFGSFKSLIENLTDKYIIETQ